MTSIGVEKLQWAGAGFRQSAPNKAPTHPTHSIVGVNLVALWFF